MRVVLIVGGVIIAVLLTFMGWRFSLRVRIQTELDEVRERGLPASLEDLSRRADGIIDDQGARGALVLADAGRALVGKGIPIFRDHLLPDPGKPVPGELVERCRVESAANKAALGLLRELLKIGACRYRVDYSLPPITLVSLERPSRHRLGELLFVDAVVRAEKNDTAGVHQALLILFLMAKSCEDEPGFLYELERITLLNESIRFLEHAVNRITLDQAQLDELFEKLVQADQPERLAIAYASQMAVFAGILRTAESLEAIGGPPDLKDRWNTRRLHFLGALEAEELEYLRLMRELLDITGLPYGERMSSLEEMETRLRTMRQSGSLAALGILGIVRIGGSEIDCRTGLRLARVALAILRRQRAGEEPPDSLDDLVPRWLSSVPEDLYTGEPLRYIKRETGFVVYSVGPDQVDNEALPLKNPGHPWKTPFDIVFRVTR